MFQCINKSMSMQSLNVCALRSLFICLFEAFGMAKQINCINTIAGIVYRTNGAKSSLNGIEKDN